MKTSKVIIAASALTLSTISLISCAKEEPAVNTVANSTATRYVAPDDRIISFTFVNTKAKPATLDSLRQYLNVGPDYRYCANVITVGDELDQNSSNYNIIKKDGYALIVVDATADQIYNWMDSNDWSTIQDFKRCPKEFKGSDEKFDYTVISKHGYEGIYSHQGDKGQTIADMVKLVNEIDGHRR